MITHIDADHIEGIVHLLQDAESLKYRFERIWFNGGAGRSAKCRLAAFADSPGITKRLLGIADARHEARKQPSLPLISKY